MTPLLDWLRDLLGLGADVEDLGALQMALRAVVVYVLTLAMVRLGSRRFLSRATAFDVIVAIMLGSIVSRAVNGTAAMGPTLAATAVLVGVHWLIAALVSRFGRLGSLIKGDPIPLIRDGRFQRREMKRAGFSEHDLEEQFRLQARLTDVADVRLALLERSGKVSVIPAREAARVVDVAVADGVQTVRIRIE